MTKREPTAMGVTNLHPDLKAAIMPPGTTGPPTPPPYNPPEEPHPMLSRIRNEPVAFVGTLQTLWLALLTLANVFEWWSWSDTQTAAVTGVWTALTALVTWLVRGSVEPVPTPSDTQG